MKKTDEDDEEDTDDGGGGGDLLDHLTAVWWASITTLILPVCIMVGQYNQSYKCITWWVRTQITQKE